MVVTIGQANHIYHKSMIIFLKKIMQNLSCNALKISIMTSENNLDALYINSIQKSLLISPNITIARGATRKIKKIQSLGALIYCTAPLRSQSAALLVRAARFVLIYATERRAFS